MSTLFRKEGFHRKRGDCLCKQKWLKSQSHYTPNPVEKITRNERERSSSNTTHLLRTRRDNCGKTFFIDFTMCIVVKYCLSCRIPYNFIVDLELDKLYFAPVLAPHE